MLISRIFIVKLNLMERAFVMRMKEAEEKVTAHSVKDLYPGLKQLELKVILLDKTQESTRLKNGNILTQFRVADKTGSILCNIIGEEGEKLEPGNILYLDGAYTTLYKGRQMLYNGKKGLLLRMREFFFLFSESPNKSEVHVMPA